VKISVTYLVSILLNGYPPKFTDEVQTFKDINKLGFRYLEMEGLGREHSENVRKNIDIYKKALSDNDIQIHNFCIVDPNLVSLDANLRQTAYDNFKLMAEVAQQLDAETLHLASYAPPVTYKGRKPYQLDGGEYTFDNKPHISIPDGFKWQPVWDTLVESCRFCASVAQEYDKTIIMEPRVGEIICSVDSMIRLIQDVDMQNFKANFDTGHFSAQREDVCLALMKLDSQFANIHIADNNPTSTNHLPLGEGIIDWYEFFRILVKMGYNGYLGLDIGARTFEELSRGLLKSRDYIVNITEQLGVKVKW